VSKDYTDFYHTGPGTLAGRYLRRFWQPVSRAEDLKRGRALPVRVMGEDLTVYRGEGGTVHLVASQCAHRGTQLSTGWVEGDGIRCRYHGWKYDGSGQCVEQPGEDASFAEKVKIKSYPAREHLGLIFAYLGEGEPPPLPRFEEYERPGLISVGPPEVWPCNYFNRLDNACDVGHVSFTHSESLGRANQAKHLAVPALSAEETEFGIRTSVTRPGEQADIFKFHMPNTNQAPPGGRVEGSTKTAATLRADRLFWRVPIDDAHCVSFVVSFLPLTGDEARKFQEQREKARASIPVSPNELGEAILAGKMRLADVDKNLGTYYLFWVEDYVVQVGQGISPDRTLERLGRVDVGVILLRKIWERELRALAEDRPLKQWTRSLSTPGPSAT